MEEKTKYILIGSAAFIMSLILYFKFTELRNMVVDGDGVGISLLGFEISDSVPNDKITAYANGFLATALVILLPVIYCINNVSKQKSP